VPILNIMNVMLRYKGWWMHCFTKFQRDKYYRDVEIDIDSIVSIPERPTNVFTKLQIVDCDMDEIDPKYLNVQRLDTNMVYIIPSNLWVTFYVLREYDSYNNAITWYFIFQAFQNMSLIW